MSQNNNENSIVDVPPLLQRITLTPSTSTSENNTNNEREVTDTMSVPDMVSTFSDFFKNLAQTQEQNFLNMSQTLLERHKEHLQNTIPVPGEATIRKNSNKKSKTRGEATISVNPSKKVKGKATISKKPSAECMNTISLETPMTTCTPTRKRKINIPSPISKRLKAVKGRHPVARVDISESEIDTSEAEGTDTNDQISVHAPSDIDEQLHGLINERENNEEESSAEENLIEIISNELSNIEHTGKPITQELANIINVLFSKPLARETLTKKLESNLRPSNLESLKVRKCNSEIWSEMLQTATRSRDVKNPKLQTCILKSSGIIANVTDFLLKLKSNKDNVDKKELNDIIHSCSDALALNNHVNSELEQKRRVHIVSTLDKSYAQLAKNVPNGSEFLFGDDITKRITAITMNKKLFNNRNNYNNNQNFKNTQHYSKNFRRFPQNPGNRYQGSNGQQYQNNRYHQNPKNNQNQKFYKQKKN